MPHIPAISSKTGRKIGAVGSRDDAWTPASRKYRQWISSWPARLVCGASKCGNTASGRFWALVATISPLIKSVNTIDPPKFPVLCTLGDLWISCVFGWLFGDGKKKWSVVMLITSQIKWTKKQIAVKITMSTSPGLKSSKKCVKTWAVSSSRNPLSWIRSCFTLKMAFFLYKYSTIPNKPTRYGKEYKSFSYQPNNSFSSALQTWPQLLTSQVPPSIFS